jgi:hypothetical protein
MRAHIVRMHQQFSLIDRCFNSTPLVQWLDGHMAIWLQYLSDIIAGVEFATFSENLDQMECARIPTDREHEFCRLNCVSFPFGDFFISW